MKVTIKKFGEKKGKDHICWYMLEYGTKVECSEHVLSNIWWQYIDSLNASEREDIDGWAIFVFKQPQECEI